jgi:hypothetical protein
MKMKTEVWLVVICVCLVAALALGSFLASRYPPARGYGPAGRHHLRERSEDFFGTDQIAARYHTRTRAAKFFGRGVC